MRNSKEILARISFVALILICSMLGGPLVTHASESVSEKKKSGSSQPAKEEKPRLFCTGIFSKRDKATEFCPMGSQIVEVIDFWDQTIRGFGCDCTDLDPGTI